ncbi:hypothetical protein OR16_26428 [Cupriavidus basilensis OR16]|uniref:Uncharacterized protein n=1 Tax=Cupriavidus basilensis OR16 TaxID=1127483 RepID=H1SAX2_9BURK|nr:hypothetical protein [Cupriavidus basilensis]EHP40349.1 hypothetical protein OR16_26428 [Cupriavidus basilensis OR16]
MLRLIAPFTGKAASDSDTGDLNGFLRDVLVEVAGENYRQTMYEAMALASAGGRGVQYDLDPPLRANERVMSGLFATAISRVALRSRTEVRIDRPERDSNVDALEHDFEGDGTPMTKNGRVDYLAWYGSRVIGIELKMASMNCDTPKVTKSIERRWVTAVDQARTVQTCLRARQKEDGRRYPNPISIALMVIVGRRSIDMLDFDDINEGIEWMEDTSVEMLAGLKPRPAFVATYTFPEEFRALTPRRKGKEAPKNGRAIYTPFVSFIAKAAVNSTGG